MLQRSWLWLFALYSAAALPLFAGAGQPGRLASAPNEGLPQLLRASRTSGGQASRGELRPRRQRRQVEGVGSPGV